MDEQLKAKLQKLNILIDEELNLVKFRTLAEKLATNNEVIDKVVELKTLQKKAVFFEATEKNYLLEETEAAIIKKMTALEEIPIYKKYISQKTEVDRELSNIIAYLNDEISKKITKDKEEVNKYE